MMTVANARDTDAYTPGEEILHALTHGVGALLSVPAILFLLSKAIAVGASGGVVAVALYGGSMFLMFASSTLYHGAFRTSFRSLFKMFDHMAIYLMIAGAYTPFALVTLPPAVGRPLLTLYLAMGWAAVFVIGCLVDLLPPAGLAWLVAGGLCFTVGAAFYAMKSLRYSHAVWRLFVMAGVACHFVAIYGYVL